MHSLEEIKKKVNKFVELPCLGGILPKELNKEDIQQVLMTPERISLVEHLWNAINLGKEGIPNRDRNFGMILSGPNGIGKSVDSYILTSVAYMNGAFVIYIVSVSSLLFFSFIKPLNYFYCAMIYFVCSHQQVCGLVRMKKIDNII